MQVLQETPAGKSICPTQIAKSIDPKDPKWSRHSKNIRREAMEMAKNGQISVLRKGKPTNPNEDIKGVIRLRLPTQTDKKQEN